MERHSAQPCSLGISPCPNDTFIFHALLHKLVACPVDFSLKLADVEQLNSLACAGKPDVTKMSLGVAARIMDQYALLSSGAALGWGCGPLVVAREPLTAAQCRWARVAVPGAMTTADLLLTMHGGFQGPRTEMVFNEVMPALVRGDVELGVIIHEGRFTYEGYGLKKILDLGQWWEETYRVPLPLGAIAVRRDLPLATARAIQEAIADSLRYAWAHPDASKAFIHEHAQELDDAVTSAHIQTFVTDYSLDLGTAGRKAIELLVGHNAAMLGKSIPAEGLFLA